MTTDLAPRRRSHWKGPRLLVQTRVPVELAERLRADAAAAGLTVSDHLGALLAREAGRSRVRAMTADSAPRHRARWKGPRLLVQTRVPVELGEQLHADAAAAGLTVSHHLGTLLAGLLHPEEVPARRRRAS